MENKRGNVLTVFLVIAIILIVVMGALLYMQKTEADRQIAELENNASEMQETINDLQGKIDTISNTINSNKTPEVDNTQKPTDEVKYDVEIEMSELEEIDHTNNQELKKFFNKYNGKTVKVTGYVCNFGDDAIVPTSTELATYVNIGNSKTYKERVYAGGTTFDADIIKQINKLKVGQKISIVGNVSEESYPLRLDNVKIIEE